MPGHYNMPAPPNRYPLDKNDKLGLLIGSLLSGGLGYAGSKNTGENPWARALAGGVVGLGAGGKQINDNYSAMFDDYLKGEGMDFRNRQMTQEQKQFQDTLGLNREKFGEEKRHNENLDEYYKTDKRAPIDYNKIRDERTLRRLDIKKKQKELSGGGISGDKTTQQLLEEAINEGKQPVNQITLDRFLNEARKVNPGIPDDELTRYYNKKYGQ